MSMLQRFWNDESGPELVEWAVVTIILLVAAIVLYIAVGKVLGGVICSIWCWLDKIKDPGMHEQLDGSQCQDARGDSSTAAGDTGEGACSDS